MKKIAQLLVSLMLLSVPAAAQTYNFTYFTGTYTSLTSAASINNNAVWSNGTAYRIPIGFHFTFMGTVYDSVYAKGGDAAFELFPLKKTFCTANFISDRGTSTSLSPISYKLVGNPGSRILMIEWANVGYPDGPSSDYINAQIWLYEEGNCIEAHYGPNSVTSQASYDPFFMVTGEFLGVYAEDPSGTPILNALQGPPTAPVMTTNDATYHGLTGTPADGSIYRFCPITQSNTGIDEAQDAELNVYPNPAQNIVHLSLDPTVTVKEISVMDVSGREVMKCKESCSSIDVSQLQAGVYFVQVRSGERTIIQKIIRQ